MSMLPMSGNKFAPNPWMVDHLPQIYMGMGLTAEEVQRKYGVSREDADQFAYRSHQNALRAQAEGKFDDEIVPVEIEHDHARQRHAATRTTRRFKKDEGPRADTSLEALAKLKPVFHADGTVTAGNSSQTSDGAAAAIVMSEKKAQGAGPEADGALRELRGGRRAAGDHGHRAGGGDSESADAGRAEDRTTSAWSN